MFKYIVETTRIVDCSQVVIVRPEESCMVQNFFKNEEKKPAHLRATTAMISCPCKRCNPICF